MSQSAGTADYFQELKEWSKRKLELIDKYLESAVRIMGSIDTVHYVDGFAGPGHYGDGGTGSPVRALELAQRLQREGKSYRLKCINVEENSEHFANLVQATAAASDIVTNISGEFNDHIDDILRRIGTKPAVFFLDPFGVEGIDWAKLVKIIRREGQTDLWMRLDVSYVRRLDGFYDSLAPDAPAKFRLLQRAYGVDDRDELHERLSGPNEESRIRSAIILYMSRLRNEFANAKGNAYVGGYPIKTIDGQVKYYLLLAGAHPKAGVLASDIVYSVEHSYQRDVEEYRAKLTQQLNMFDHFDPSQAEIDDKKALELAESLWNACQDETMTRLAARASVWQEWFGRVSKRHATAALRHLHSKGKVRVRQGSLGDDDAVIIFEPYGAAPE